MNKKVFCKILLRTASFVIAALFMFSFAACKNDDGVHMHRFAETLTQDKTEHYYECECGMKKDIETHSYVNGVCKCGKTDPNAHKHDFTGAWVQGETEHYHKCNGCEETRDREAHSYVNGVCKCGKADPNAHRHDFTGAWVQGEAEHYHKCSGCEETRDREAHSYIDGVCKCGKADPNAHKHDFTGAWVQGETEHYHKCSGCEETRDHEAHSYIDGVCKCGKTDPNAKPGYSFPESVNFGNDVAVHDPSVFKDPKTNRYYAFGSHFAVASSNDLIHWTQEVYDGSAEDSGQREAQKLYGNGVNWRTVLTKAVAHAGTSAPSTWAPDVEYYNGKYYMYVSLSSFGSNRSAIVRVEADSVLGVYGNEQMIVKSSNGDDPNCIDPELFYDKEGGLWMVYGSFFGGIYIKELYNSGANWGLPKESGFGTKLWQGALGAAEQGGPEGPYIFHDGDYYYLMVSDGSLSSNYHMRVARSANPAGPYYDITGADMAAAHGKGNKLAGNWQFDGETGKAAYGHNSVCEIDGEFFVVAHMRYYEYGNVSGGHNVRVHRLLFNEQGWPVLASERYAGETLGTVEEREIAGKYDLILHSEGTSAAFVTSTRYTFTADHKITLNGAASGTWSYKEDGNFIGITLNGVTYRGTAIPVWTENGGVISFSAVSDTGRSLWANGSIKAQDPQLNIIQQVSGSANNTVVSAFVAEGGFTVSFRSAVAGTAAGDDWNAIALVCKGLQISLPNLRATAGNAAGLATADMYPNGGGMNVGGANWNCYLGKSSFVTIALSLTDGVKFYQNGACTQNYPMTDPSVSAFVNAFFKGVGEEGFVFAESGFTASDLIVSRGAANADMAAAIYHYYG